MEQKFLNQLATDNISHAYLINSIDENFIAKIFDVLKIDPSEITEIFENKIEQIRLAKNWLYKKPIFGNRKALIVRKVDELSIPAQNSLLKILEEPPEYAIIFLFSLKEDRLLPTIKSRCRIIRINNESKMPDFDEIDRLRGQDLSERFKFAEKAAKDYDLDDLLDQWLLYFHQKMLAGENVVSKITKIKAAKAKISTNINKRLLLENILIEF